MKIINNVRTQIGDVIQWEDGILVKIIYDKFNKEYPYRLLNIETEEVVDCYETLFGLQEDYPIIISKLDDTEIILN